MQLLVEDAPFEKSLTPFIDDRGVFCLYEDDGMEIIQDNKLYAKMSRSYFVKNHVAGVIRGFHYHQHEWKVFTIVSGAAKFVAVKDPDMKKTDFEIQTFVASELVPKLIVVPPNWYNGWMSLQPNTTLLCLSSSSTKESIADDKRVDPYYWGDYWTIKSR